MTAVYVTEGRREHVDLRGLRTDLHLSIVQLNLQMSILRYLLDVLHVPKRRPLTEGKGQSGVGRIALGCDLRVTERLGHSRRTHGSRRGRHTRDAPS